MKIGIIGAGSLGRAVGTRLAASGHAIMFGGGASAHEAATEHTVLVLDRGFEYQGGVLRASLVIFGLG